MFGDPINGLSTLNYRLMTNFPFGVGLYYASVNDTDWGGLPLPLDLSLLGITGGCQLYVAISGPEVVSSATLVGAVDGSYTIPIPIPSNPALVDKVVHFQGVGVDAATFGISLTSKLSVTIQ